VPIIVFHGDRDNTVHPNNGDQILEQSVRTKSTQKKVHRGRVPGGHAYTRTIHTHAIGRRVFEHWNIHGAGHAWSGGSPAGSYTDPRGPDATREMLRFFLEHSLPQQPIRVNPFLADLTAALTNVRLVPILLQKSFWGGERKF
jgi:poly(3-hydroxybutyrate) depolymerase